MTSPIIFLENLTEEQVLLGVGRACVGGLRPQYATAQAIVEVRRRLSSPPTVVNQLAVAKPAAVAVKARGKQKVLPPPLPANAKAVGPGSGAIGAVSIISGMDTFTAAITSYIKGVRGHVFYRSFEILIGEQPGREFLLQIFSFVSAVRVDNLSRRAVLLDGHMFSEEVLASYERFDPHTRIFTFDAGSFNLRGGGVSLPLLTSKSMSLILPFYSPRWIQLMSLLQRLTELGFKGKMYLYALDNSVLEDKSDAKKHLLHTSRSNAVGSVYNECTFLDTQTICHYPDVTSLSREFSGVRSVFNVFGFRLFRFDGLHPNVKVTTKPGIIVRTSLPLSCSNVASDETFYISNYPGFDTVLRNRIMQVVSTGKHSTDDLVSLVMPYASQMLLEAINKSGSNAHSEHLSMEAYNGLTSHVARTIIQCNNNQTVSRSVNVVASYTSDLASAASRSRAVQLFDFAAGYLFPDGIYASVACGILYIFMCRNLLQRILNKGNYTTLKAMLSATTIAYVHRPERFNARVLYLSNYAKLMLALLLSLVKGADAMPHLSAEGVCGMMALVILGNVYVALQVWRMAHDDEHDTIVVTGSSLDAVAPVMYHSMPIQRLVVSHICCQKYGMADPTIGAKLGTNCSIQSTFADFDVCRFTNPALVAIGPYSLSLRPVTNKPCAHNAIYSLCARHLLETPSPEQGSWDRLTNIFLANWNFIFPAYGQQIRIIDFDSWMSHLPSHRRKMLVDWIEKHCSPSSYGMREWTDPKRMLELSAFVKVEHVYVDPFVEPKPPRLIQGTNLFYQLVTGVYTYSASKWLGNVWSLLQHSSGTSSELEFYYFGSMTPEDAGNVYDHAYMRGRSSCICLDMSKFDSYVSIDAKIFEKVIFRRMFTYSRLNCEVSSNYSNVVSMFVSRFVNYRSFEDALVYDGGTGHEATKGRAGGVKYTSYGRRFSGMNWTSLGNTLICSAIHYLACEKVAEMSGDFLFGHEVPASILIMGDDSVVCIKPEFAEIYALCSRAAAVELGFKPKIAVPRGFSNNGVANPDFCSALFWPVLRDGQIVHVLGPKPFRVLCKTFWLLTSKTKPADWLAHTKSIALCMCAVAHFVPILGSIMFKVLSLIHVTAKEYRSGFYDSLVAQRLPMSTIVAAGIVTPLFNCKRDKQTDVFFCSRYNISLALLERFEEWISGWTDIFVNLDSGPLGPMAHYARIDID